MFYEPPENTVSDIYNNNEEEDDFGKTDFGIKRRISKAYDIWSLGLIICELYSGEPPWGEELKKKPNQIILNLMNKVEFPIPAKLKNQKIINIIKYCTETYPKYRIEIREVINLLNKLFIDKLRSEFKLYDIRLLFSNKESILILIKFRFTICN